MRFLSLLVVVIVGGAAFLLLGGLSQPVHFASDVQPVLVQNCAVCHRPGGEGFLRKNLDLRSYDSIMRGGSDGPVVIAGDPDPSLMLKVAEGRADSKLQSVHAVVLRGLSADDREKLRNWVKSGAKND